MDAALIILAQAATTIGDAMLGEAGKRVIGVAWEETMATIKRRFGPEHPAPSLLNELRNAAGDEKQMAPIRDKLAGLRFAQDPEVIAATERLATAMQHYHQGANVINANIINGAVNVYGNQNNNFG